MKKMTLSELQPIFSDYANWLEGWQPVGKDKLVRVDGPIAQGLWLDRLRTGQYRPTVFVQVLSIPNKSGVVLLNHLKRAVDPRNHGSQFSNIKSEANRDTFPSLKKPLDAKACYAGLEQRISNNPAQLVCVASLAAFFGDASRYQSFKAAFFHELDNRFVSTKDKWMADYSSFIAELDATDDARSHLQPIIDANMKSEGYA